MLWLKSSTIIASLVLSTTAFAANPYLTSKQKAAMAASQSMAQPAAPAAPVEIFSGFIQGQRSTSLYDFQDGTRQDSMDYTFRLAAKLGANSKYTMKLTAIYSDNLNANGESDWADTAISIGRAPAPVGRYLLMAPAAVLGLPTSKESRDHQQLQATGKVALTTIVNPERLITGLSIVVNLVGARNFHKYDTMTDGKVNTEYQFIQNPTFVYSIGDFSMTADFAHVNTWSYQNTMKDVFQFTQELGYQFNKTFAGALGHTNGGSTLKANGIESNVQLINENTSLVYASMTVSF